MLCRRLKEEVNSLTAVNTEKYNKNQPARYVSGCNSVTNVTGEANCFLLGFKVSTTGVGTVNLTKNSMFGEFIDPMHEPPSIILLNGYTL